MGGHDRQVTVHAQACHLLPAGGVSDKSNLFVPQSDQVRDTQLTAFVIVAGDRHAMDTGKDAVHKNQRIFVQGHL